MINSAYAFENETQFCTDNDFGIKSDETTEMQNNTNFDSIQKLINDSNPGDSIYLENKTYCGNGTAITINKDISIYAVKSGETVLDANDMSSIFIAHKYVHKHPLGYAGNSN